MSPEGQRNFESRYKPGRRANRPLRSALHPRSAVGRALRLAGAIQARSTSMARRMGRTPMILLNRLPPPSASTSATTLLELNVKVAGRADPVQLLRTNPSAPANAIRPASPVRPMDRPLIELALPAAPNAPVSMLDTIQRIVEQHVRVETGARYHAAGLAPTNPSIQQPATSGLVGSAAPDLQPAPPRQVLRPSATPLAAPETAAGVGAMDPVAPGTPALPAAPPLDVNRLTDQIIQAIDRRIIASRERLGRI